MYIEQNAHVAREVIEAPLCEDWECLRDLYAKDAVLKGTPEPVRGSDTANDEPSLVHSIVSGDAGQFFPIEASPAQILVAGALDSARLEVTVASPSAAGLRRRDHSPIP